MPQTERTNNHISRKKFIQNCSMSMVAIAAHPFVSKTISQNRSLTNLRTAGKILSLNENWLFGGKFNESILKSGYKASTLEPINLPHCVTKLSWHEWDPSDWQNQWIYRKHFTRPSDTQEMRAFLHFEAVMVGATPIINGHPLPAHLGGYLPFSYEITDLIKDENELNVIVDSRWSNVPPEGADDGAKRIDYLEPGGIHRSVNIAFVPRVFISDVYAKPVNVLQSDRRVDVTFTIDAGTLPKSQLDLNIELKRHNSVIAKVKKQCASCKKAYLPTKHR